MMNKLLRASLLLIILLTASLTSSVKAITVIKPAPKGITVSPAFQQVSIAAGESEHPIKFIITNNEPKAQVLDLSAADFSTLNESGGLFFVGTNPTALQKKYGLAKWMSLPQKQITLQPNQTQTINASILNLPDLSPGGHYGALMIGINGTDTISKNNNVALHPVASSLLFVTKIGGDTHKLSLASVSANHSVFSLPSSVNLRFHNDGNTHLIPRGEVSLLSPHNKIISKGIINDASNIILPETYRQLYVPLQKITNSNQIGHYKLKVDFRFDGISQFRSYQSSFWFAPSAVVTILVILIIVGLILIFNKNKLFRKLRKPKKSHL